MLKKEKRAEKQRTEKTALRINRTDNERVLRIENQLNQQGNNNTAQLNWPALLLDLQ